MVSGLRQDRAAGGDGVKAADLAALAQLVVPGHPDVADVAPAPSAPR
jgi:hypothetical protein